MLYLGILSIPVDRSSRHGWLQIIKSVDYFTELFAAVTRAIFPDNQNEVVSGEICL